MQSVVRCFFMRLYIERESRMILYEAEDMVNHTKGLIEFTSEIEADKILREKGFKPLSAFECYAGISETGHEISVMKAVGNHHNMLKKVNQI